MNEADPIGEKKLNEVRNEIVSALTPIYGDREAKAMVGIIFENLKGWNRVDMALKADQLISPFIIHQIDSVVRRLLDHEPIQYIFGNAWFYGMRLKVTSDTLIPRPETAELVDYIVKDYREKSDQGVLDLCTGTGCIAIALARNLPFSKVTAVDVSAKALAVAQDNAISLHANVNFLKTDILKDNSGLIAGQYDVIVSNPPYIAEKEKSDMDRNVLAYEPHLALFVPDDDPLVFYNAIFRISLGHLTDTGKVYCEINPVYAAEVRDLAVRKGFGNVDLVRDSYGKERFLIAWK